MAFDNFVQITGNCCADPELRFTTGGVAVTSFTLAWTARKKADGGGWEDGETSFFRCTAWRDMGENVAASIQKGMRVMVTGAVKVREWEDQEGNKRTSVEIDADDVAPSLKWAQAEIERTTREKPKADAPAAPAYEDEEPF